MIKLAPFEQSRSMCGPAALKILLQYYGVDESEEELRRLTGATFAEGTAGESIVAAAQRLGFEAFSKDLASFKDIRYYVLKRKIPVIVNWFPPDHGFRSDGHYSVVVDIKRETICLQDPAIGDMRHLLLSEFLPWWFDYPGKYMRTKDDLILRRMIVIEKPKAQE